MLMSTTPYIDGKNIKECKGLIYAEDVSFVFATIMSDITKKYQDTIIEGRNKVINTMIEEANKLGSNAIIGIKIDIIPKENSCFIITGIGTAVVIE